MPQLRVLILAGEAPQSATAVAADLGVHPSNATRTCDRLVAGGLLSRQQAEDDRRRVELTLTESGRRLVDQVMEHRRARVAAIMAGMSRTDRAALAEALTAFADAAGVAGAGTVEANPIHARHG
jgi:DNA-binding MarR family transcriptional regulator